MHSENAANSRCTVQYYACRLHILTIRIGDRMTHLTHQPSRSHNLKQTATDNTSTTAMTETKGNELCMMERPDSYSSDVPEFVTSLQGNSAIEKVRFAGESADSPRTSRSTQVAQGTSFREAKSLRPQKTSKLAVWAALNSRGTEMASPIIRP
jgi:hypothetical protein